jgi:pyruvate dehydrogenase E1 component alpha subunit
VFHLQKRVFEGSVDYIQVMDENGVIDQALFPKDLTDAKIVEMYRYMCFARALDEKALSLQRQGRAVTYAPLVGEEATQIGSALAMRTGDLFVPNFRQHGVFLARGMPLDIFLLNGMGFEDGNHIPKEVGGFPVCIPVGSQMPHAAVGCAFAQKYKKTGAAVVAYVGDGGTSEGRLLRGAELCRGVQSSH